MISGIELQYVKPGGDESEDGLETIVAAYERAGGELQDFGRYLWPRLTSLLEETVKEQFDSEGSEGNSGSWAPLSAQYAAWKASNYPGTPILQRERAMYEGLTESSSPFAFRQQTGNDYNFGTRGVQYASFHQSGTSRMPPRPVFDFGGEFDSELVRAGAAAAREALKQARFDEAHDLSDLGDE